MARQPEEQHAATRSTSQEKLQQWAEPLAAEHGLPVSRLIRIRKRTLESHLPPEVQPAYLRLALKFEPALQRALGYLPAHEVLSLFERSDPLMLAARDYLVRSFSHPATPFYTLPEIEGLFFEFSRHQEANREHLLRTGYPATSFERCRWLDRLLGLLYPVKLPAGFFGPKQLEAEHHAPRAADERDLVHDAEGNVVYDYVWAADSAQHAFADVREAIEGALAPKPWGYDDAPFIAELPGDMGRQLDTARKKFLDAEIRVLKVTAKLIRHGDASVIWPAALAALVEGLCGEEMEFLLDVDQRYDAARADPRLAVTYRRGCPPVTRTLTALLSLIGFLEKEKIGTLTQTKKDIEAALSHPCRVRSYFQFVGEANLPDIDRALDDVWRRLQAEPSFWAEFDRRVNDAVAREFEDEVRLTSRVKREHKAKFTAFAQPFLDFQAAHMKETGHIASLRAEALDTGGEVAANAEVERTAQAEDQRNGSTLPSPNADSPHKGDGSLEARRFVFRRDGYFWCVEYDGHKLPPVRHSVGLNYIAELLRHPGCPIGVLDLVQAVAGAGILTPTISASSQEGLSLRRGQSALPGITPEERTRFEESLEDLRDQMREAEANNDAGRQMTIRAKIEGIEDHLAKARGLSGRSRETGGFQERARKSVSKAIGRAIEQLRKHDKRLGRHLDSSIDRGFECQYAPQDPTVWEF
jgi:hypothetical protein